MPLLGFEVEFHIKAGVHRVRTLGVSVQVPVLGYMYRLQARRVRMDVVRQIDILSLGDVSPASANLLDRSRLEVIHE